MGITIAEFFLRHGYRRLYLRQKVPGIRAALTHNAYSADRAAKSNDAHIITMGARVIGPELAKTIVDTWLAASFDPEGPSVGNVKAVDRLGEKYAKRENV